MIVYDNYKEHVDDINIISSFLSSRDIPYLDQKSIYEKYGIRQADLLILMTSSVLYECEKAAEAFKKGIAKKLMLVGGIGHTTYYLRKAIKTHPVYKYVDVEDRPEADIMGDVFIKYLGIKEEDIILENRSTNCGANAELALKVLEEKEMIPETAILMQDPVMQLRIYASFLQQWKGYDVNFINYAAFVPEVGFIDGRLKFVNDIEGLWDMERFLSLIKGEIPRLLDNENGYGPKGKGFIDHVDIPQYVIDAYKSIEPLLLSIER